MEHDCGQQRHSPASLVRPGEHKLATSRRCRGKPSYCSRWKGLARPTQRAILGVDETNLRELIDESGRELASELASDVLIIEDETITAMELESLVKAWASRPRRGAHPSRSRRASKEQKPD